MHIFDPRSDAKCLYIWYIQIYTVKGPMNSELDVWITLFYTTDFW